MSVLRYIRYRFKASFCLLIGLLFSISSLNTQSADLFEIPVINDIEIFGIPEGLSQSSALAMVVDTSGFIWVGTQDGLNRFDGYQFTQFRHEPSNSNSISANRIASLYNDSKDRLWIGTYTGGLNILDKSTGIFTRYNHDIRDTTSLWANNVNAIVEDEDGNFWIGTDRGINFIDGRSLEISRIQHFSSNLHEHFIFCILIDENEIMWLGTEEGLIEYNVKTNEFHIYKYDESNIYSISNSLINALHKDRYGNLWIGTADGLNRYEGAGKFYRYYKNADSESGIDPINILCIYEDDTENLWLGTPTGVLFLRDKNAMDLVSVNAASGIKPNPLAQNIKFIDRDHQGNLWTGLWGTGLARINIDKGRFTPHKHDPLNKNSIPFKHVVDIYEDNAGFVWISTYNYGISRWNRSSNTYDHYSHNTQNEYSIHDNRAFSFLEDHRSDLFISFYRGLQKYDPKQDNFKLILGSEEINYGPAWPQCQTKKNEFFLGTIGDGLLHMNAKKELINRYHLTRMIPIVLTAMRYKSYWNLKTKIYGWEH